MGRTVFSDLIGNETVKTNLAVDAATGRCAHAYIIEGAEGSGKHTLAKLLCAASVCQQRENGVEPLPCGKCPTCHRILNHLSADVEFINSNGKASIGVEAIRNMKQNLYIAPNDADKKFYIIEDAELMTVQAQNSLLLTLEEPPEYVMILLLTAHAAGLLETIRSRAPVIRMESFTPKQILDILKSGRFDLPGSPTEEALAEAAYLADGSVGKAVSLLEKDEETEGRRNLAVRFAEGLVSKTRTSELLEFVNDSLNLDRSAVLDVLLLTKTAVRDMIVMKKADSDLFLFYFSEEDLPEETRRTSLRKLIGLYDLIHNAYENISMNGSVQTSLTELVLKRDKNK